MSNSSASLRSRSFDPLIFLWILLAAVLIFLIVNPLYQLIQTSLQDADTGAFTLRNYVAAYSRPRYLTAMWNSIRLGFSVTVLCLLFAVPMAWAVSRTDMPGKGLVRILVLGAFITPPYLGAIGWILLAGPNSGWINRIWMALTGAEHPIPICADASCRTRADLDRLQGKYGFVDIRLDKAGGLSEALALAGEARRRGFRIVVGGMIGTSLGIAAPEFFIGLLLVLVVALNWGWLPATGYIPFTEDPVEYFARLTLPSITLGLGVAAELARQVRGAMIDVLSRDYIQTARAKGLSTFSIIVKHGLKNAAIPVVTVLGLQIRRLLGGAVIVEQIFAMNGVGSLAVRAVFLRDLPVLLGVALTTAVVVLFVNLLVDMSYSYFDPKVRTA